MIDVIVSKGRRIVVPASLQQQALEQLHSNDMVIENMLLLVHESIYWLNIDDDVDNTKKLFNVS